jgi:environmental stress-induced protein Ves
VQSPKLQIIRKSSFTAAPWKNGGGITHEAIRVPAGGDSFRWRLSVAHIEAPGPFSEFAAHNRKMVLLKGAGIELHFADGVQKTLRRVGELAEFDGAMGTRCELLGGPCVDLNLMVVKSESAAVRVERFIESFAVRAARNETTLVFPIDRKISLQITAGKTATLEPWDLAVLSQCAGRVSRLESANSSVSTAVFVATLAGEPADG